MLIGIVGKPSAGKSTFFKAATLADVDIANYPFTTIKPNHGTGYVRVECVDKEFNTTCNPRFGVCRNGSRFVPVELLDVAGLVPGAHEGKGMGNQFLDDLNQANVLVHIIDVSGSTNDKGEPVDPLSYDPANDIKFLEDELDHWYLRLVKKGWDKFARGAAQDKSQLHKTLAKQLSSLRVTETIAQETLQHLQLDPSIMNWSEEQIFEFAQYLRKKTKPIIIAANKADVPGAAENVQRLQEQFVDYIIVPCSAESELALKEADKHELLEYIPGTNTFEIKQKEKLSEQQLKALDFIQHNMLDKFGSSGVQQALDDAVFKLLKYKAIFPGGVSKLEDQDGNRLPDCFLLKEDATALDFAFYLHTDIGNAFVKAIDVKTKKPVGKEHVLMHRDVVEIATSR